MFRNHPQAKCPAVIGEGALRIASGDQVKFLYLLGACGLYPGLRYALSGHYIIYGGSGKFAGAHGRGTFRETGILNLGAPGDARANRPTETTPGAAPEMGAALFQRALPLQVVNFYVSEHSNAIVPDYSLQRTVSKASLTQAGVIALTKRSDYSLDLLT